MKGEERKRKKEGNEGGKNINAMRNVWEYSILYAPLSIRKWQVTQLLLVLSTQSKNKEQNQVASDESIGNGLSDKLIHSNMRKYYSFLGKIKELNLLFLL